MLSKISTDMEIKEVLKKLGLKDDEAAVYLSALELGPSLVARIAKNAGVKRTSVYMIAKSLIRKGLLGEYSTKHGIHLSAEPPEHLLLKIEEMSKDVTDILPQLKALTKKESSQPQVKYFEGEDGYLAISQDILQKHVSEVLWLGNPEELYKIIDEKKDNEYYLFERTKRKIKLRALLLKTSYSKKYKTGYDPDLLRHIEFLPNDFPFQSSEVIYQDKVAFITSSKELVCVIIESRDLTEMERAKFEMLWKRVKKN